MHRIYLDNNATTPLLPEVADAMDQCLRSGYANPASQHAAGRRARRRLEQAREAIGRLLGARLDSAHADQVIFTSGGTESNNLALLGLIQRNHAHTTPGRLLISAIEHPSVVGAAAHLERLGWCVDRVSVDHNCVIDLGELRSLMDPTVRLVSVMLGNNETGVIQPVVEVAAVCRAAGIPLHTDAVQAVGKLPVDFRELGVDALSCAAHKFHGPRGIGVLLVRWGVQIEPILHGSFQQAGLRPGTESVALAVGMQKALEIWHTERQQRSVRLTALRDRLEDRLLAGCPDAVIHDRDADRLPQTTNVSFPGVDRQALVAALDLAGVDCSTGSACASGSSEPSPVLRAMGTAKALLDGSIRLSLGCHTTVAEVEESANRILKAVNHLRRPPEARKSQPTPPARSLHPL